MWNIFLCDLWSSNIQTLQFWLKYPKLLLHSYFVLQNCPTGKTQQILQLNCLMKICISTSFSALKFANSLFSRMTISFRMESKCAIICCKVISFEKENMPLIKVHSFLASKGKTFRSEIMKLATAKHRSGESNKNVTGTDNFIPAICLKDSRGLCFFCCFNIPSLNLSQKARGISPSSDEMK